MAITKQQEDEFFRLINEGWKPFHAAQRVGFSERTATRKLKQRQLTLSAGRQHVTIPGELALENTHPAGKPGPKPHANIPVPEAPLARHQLAPDALDCLNDFARFRARYLGRISSPWQEHAAHVIAQKLATPYKEFGVINVAPGGGKSTTFTHDIPLWLTVRNRTLRGFIGSATASTAKSYTRRLRSSLERPVPEEADEEALRFGLAFDATAAPCVEYGRFKPLANPDQAAPPWAEDRFTVLQHGETLVGDKESTWSAWGWDSGFLGWRVNFIIWDDLVTQESFATVEAQDKMRLKWRNVAETRLEPGGLLILQGQRLGAEDLYRYCIDREVPDFTEEDLDDFLDLGTEQLPMRKKYFHIVYPAHNDATCRAADNPRAHSMRAEPFDPGNPESSGCLLDPFRISYRDLLTIQHESPSEYRTTYQQEDADPSSVLIPKLWIDGGEGGEGEHPGCWDTDRGPLQPPKLPKGAFYRSYMTVDPSPTKYWAIQWWIYIQSPFDAPHMGNRYLMDLAAVRLSAPEFLDIDLTAGQYTGLLVDWVNQAKQLNFPLQYLIFENNAAQRFVLQYPWFRTFLAQRNVQLKAHATSSNKADPEFGVQTIRNHYRHGRKRLPGTPAGRQLCKQLVYELTHHPDAARDDQVMADWFGEFNLPKFTPSERSLPSLDRHLRPSWLGGRRAG